MDAEGPSACANCWGPQSMGPQFLTFKVDASELCGQVWRGDAGVTVETEIALPFWGSQPSGVNRSVTTDCPAWSGMGWGKHKETVGT